MSALPKGQPWVRTAVGLYMPIAGTADGTGSASVNVSASGAAPVNVNIVTPALSSAPFPAISTQRVATTPPSLGNLFTIFVGAGVLWELTIRATSAGVAPLWLQLIDGAVLGKTLGPMTPGSGAISYQGIEWAFATSVVAAFSSTENVYTPVAGNVAELLSAHTVP